MKRFHISTLIRTATLAASLLLLLPEQGAAQAYEPVPVTISKEKVKIDGKICYSHIVLERQTLYSISKAYNVSVEDIYRFNPTLKETGLKKNGIILIPSADAIEDRHVGKQEEKPVGKQEEKPVGKQAEKPVEKQEEKPAEKVKRKVHTVQWFEDLDVIAEKYDISVEALMKFNNLESRKLSRRQKLQIPTPEDIAEMEADLTAEKPEEQIVETVADSISVQDTIVVNDPTIVQNKEVKAALLLPLKATGTSSHRGNMDFYSGVLLAVSDMTDKGVKVDLKVCDTGDNGLPSERYIADCDFIIGPIASADLSGVLDMSADGPYVISPLDPRAQALVASNPRLIQAPTPHSIQYQELIDWVKKDKKESDKVILITEKGARQTDLHTQMKSAIDSTGMTYKNFSYSILEGRDVLNPIMNLMTKEGSNRVIIASDSEAFVNDVVRNLNLLEYQKYEVVLYSPSKIRSFETIDVENIHNTELHTSLAYYINYDDPKVKSFLMKYRALFNTEPTQFAYQGYDLASYFIDLVSRYGENWAQMLTAEEQKMLQSTIRFVKTPEGGYINNGIKKIIYEEGWTVKEVN